jgi:toxin HigB-1
MIVSFGDIETELVYNQQRSRRLPPEIQPRALVKLMLLDAAETERDLQIPPSNRFERLKGNRNGFCSIRINDQWRIVFVFDNGQASDVCIVDYH